MAKRKRKGKAVALTEAGEQTLGQRSEVSGVYGSVAILDCPHVFDGHIIVRTTQGWRMVIFGDRAEGGCDVLSTVIRHCPTCGRELTETAPVRQYVIGRCIPVDEHLQMLAETCGIDL